MADGYGNIVVDWRCHVAAWVTSWDDVSDNLHVEARWQSTRAGYALQGWVRATVWINGVQVGHTDNSGSHRIDNSEVTVCTGDLRVAKIDDARNINCSARVEFPSNYHGGTSNASCDVPVGGINYKNPNPPKDVSFRRVDDTRIDISWGSNWDNDNLKPWKQVIIAWRGRNNGADWGAWSDQPGGNGTRVLDWSATNYAFGGLQANACYQFALYARNQAGDSSHVDSALIYTTPATPRSLTAVKTGDSEVTVTADTSGSYAWSVDFERSTDNGGTWTSVSRGLTVQNNKVTYVDTTAPAGTIVYRARAWRFTYDNGGEGTFSGYVTSNNVTTIMPPLAPTVTSPSSGSVWDASTPPVRITWTPNHPDGTAQAAAQIELSGLSSGPHVTDIKGDQANSASALSPGSYTLRVRTKGLHADWGAWSNPISFTVATPPNVTLTAPDDTIRELPFRIAWAVSDTTGVSQQKVTISSGGRTVYETTPEPDNRSLTIHAADYLPANGSELLVTVTIRGGSTLTSAATKLVTVDYTPPATPSVETMIDMTTLSATHTVRYGTPADGQPATDHILLRRIIDADTTVIATRLMDGQQGIDRLPPLRRTYQIEAVAVSESGASSTTTVDCLIETDCCCLNFGTDAADALPIGGAFTVSEKPRAATEEYHFASGDTLGLPVSYRMGYLDNTLSVSSRYDWGDGSLYRRIRRLSRDNSTAWFRNMDGSRMRVRVDISQQLKPDGPTVQFDADLTELAWKEPQWT
ncbi:fibronectin type III domain-containing protein [Bifidobacterium callimiconis]|uniref:Fibronectin type-III domain-containing protein n=1 Tax=Bifidobacterium callimiconis TaxID=2306973 RepID=A0A430FIL2_9BIFI|nr:fibronectin type III domain-containing protein [Bifidobacterium callimiconis]RSX52647.1 hypothetical protein D2E23_0375 [Bifidobacterium callimiconis]